MKIRVLKFLRWFLDGLSDFLWGLVMGVCWGHWQEHWVILLPLSILVSIAKTAEKRFCKEPVPLPEPCSSCLEWNDDYNKAVAIIDNLEQKLARTTANFISMAKARDAYKADADKARKELRIVRMTSANRFGGAL